MARGSPTGRSTSIGKVTTIAASVRAAKTKPAAMPISIIAQPAGVVKTAARNTATEAGASGPRVTRKIRCATISQVRNSAQSPADSTSIAPIRGERSTARASPHLAGSPASRLRLIS